MKDLWESIREQVKERSGSPIFGSFAIAWLCWNHRYFVILFSDVPLELRFKLADTYVYDVPAGWPSWLGVVLTGFVWPALSSLAYILVYPSISRLLLHYWDHWQTEIANDRKETQKKELLTREEGEAILLARNEERERFRKQLAVQAQELEQLRRGRAASIQEALDFANRRIWELERLMNANPRSSEVEKINDQIKDVHQDVQRLQKQWENRDPKVSVRLLDTVLHFTRQQIPATVPVIAQRLNLEDVTAVSVIEQAEQAKLIRRFGHDESGRQKYEVTPEGRAFMQNVSATQDVPSS